MKHTALLFAMALSAFAQTQTTPPPQTAPGNKMDDQPGQTARPKTNRKRNATTVPPANAPQTTPTDPSAPRTPVNPSDPTKQTVKPNDPTKPTVKPPSE